MELLFAIGFSWCIVQFDNDPCWLRKEIDNQGEANVMNALRYLSHLQEFAVLGFEVTLRHGGVFAIAFVQIRVTCSLKACWRHVGREKFRLMPLVP